MRPANLDFCQLSAVIGLSTPFNVFSSRIAAQPRVLRARESVGGKHRKAHRLDVRQGHKLKPHITSAWHPQQCE